MHFLKIKTLTLSTLIILALSACSNKNNNDTNTIEQTIGTIQVGGEDGGENSGNEGGNVGGATGVGGTGSTTTTSIDDTTSNTQNTNMQNDSNASNQETNTSTEANITEDAIPPVITLNGASNVSLNVGETYTDVGATANDNVDGDITANIMTVNPVDTTTAGTYTVTYDVNDTAGNSAVQVTRTVNVVAHVPTEDSINSIQGPTIIARGEEVTVTIDYVASQKRNLYIYLKSIGENKTYASKRINVDAGDESKSVSLEVPSDVPIDATYKYGVYIAPVGGTFSDNLGKSYQYNISVKRSSDDSNTSTNIIVVHDDTNDTQNYPETYPKCCVQQ